MNLENQTRVSTGDFAGGLEKLDIKRIEIPEFTIPCWPKDVNVFGNLGKRNYTVPLLGKDGLLMWKTGRHRISFIIEVDGAINFNFHGFIGKPVIETFGGYDAVKYKYYSANSDSRKNHVRIAALILFEQFKTEILAKTLSQLKESTVINNQIVEAVIKAFEPFVPFVVADELS